MEDSHSATTATDALYPISSRLKDPPAKCDICGCLEYGHRENLQYETLDEDDDEITRWVSGRLFKCGRSYGYTEAWIDFCETCEPAPPAVAELPEYCDVCGTPNAIKTFDYERETFLQAFICGRRVYLDGGGYDYCKAPKPETRTEARIRETPVTTRPARKGRALFFWCVCAPLFVILGMYLSVVSQALK